MYKKKIYDSLQLKPIIPKKTYPLNKDYIKKYLENSNPEHRDILQKLFDNTKHISYRTFKFVLYNNFRELIHYCKINKIETILLYLDKIDADDITEKSNFWVAQHFYQYLKKNKINIKINIIYNSNDIKYLPDNSFILILDDCSYTGKQLHSVLKKHFNNKYKIFNIYIIIAFITNDALELLSTEIPKNINIIFSNNYTIINDFFSYLTDADKLRAFIKLKIYNQYPIYFDHKLADYVSTYTDIYSGKIIDSDIVIPIISNCENIDSIDKIDVYKPLCPISPYKINYSDEDYKDDVKIKSSSLESYILSSNIKSLDGKKNKKNRNKNDNILIHYNEYNFDKEKKRMLFSNLNNYFDFIKSKIFDFINPKDIELQNIYNIIRDKPLKPYKNYKFNKKKINNYYKLIIPELIPIIKKIIQNVIYISYPEYIKELLEKINKLQLYLNENKIKTVKLFIFKIDTTNRWVSQHLFHHLKKVNIIIINDINHIINNDFVIYADDYIHININELFIDKKYTLYILTSYINSNIHKKILLNKKSNIKLLLADDIKIVYTLRKILTANEIKLFNKYTKINLSKLYNIYSDYNMYDSKYVPYDIYQGHIFNDNYLNEKTHNIYPIINNCTDIINCPLIISKELNDKN